MATGYVKADHENNPGSTDRIDILLANFMVPTGTIVMWGSSSVGAHWLICDGLEVSRTTYADLFAVIGTTFGVGDSETTFNLPDLRQRFPLGKASSGTGSTLGGSGGNIDHDHGSPITTGTPSGTFMVETARNS